MVTTTTSNTASVSWSAATDNVAVTGYDLYVNGTLKSTETGLTATVSGLNLQLVFILFNSEMKEIRSSKYYSRWNNNCSPYWWNDSFRNIFSEYVEGSSFNKALEIANFTGAGLIYLFIP
jgi:hypothetical protein